VNGLSTDCLCSGLDNFKLGMAVFDKHLQYKGINSVLAAMHNLPRHAHLGTTLQEVIGPLADEVASNIDHVFTSGQPLPNVEIVGRMPRRSGVGRWLDYYFPLKDSRGRILQVGAFVMELTRSSVREGSRESAPGSPIAEVTHDHGETLRPDERYYAGADKTRQKVVDLSPREQEVLRLLALGKTNREISPILGIGVKTVEAHRSRVMLKIDARSLVQLVHYAISHRIVEPQG